MKYFDIPDFDNIAEREHTAFPRFPNVAQNFHPVFVSQPQFSAITAIAMVPTKILTTPLLRSQGSI